MVGIAVLDLVTGELARWDVTSDHGLSTAGAAWAGDVLWWSAGPVRAEGDGVTSSKLEAHTWNPVTQERRDLGNGRGGGVHPVSTGDAPD